MNAKKLLFIILAAGFIFGCGILTGFRFCNEQSTELKTDVVELSKRNKLISSRLLTLEEESRRHAEESRLLAEGIRDINQGLTDSVNRAHSIEDRAERINYLAGILDKGITELIGTVKNLQDSRPNITSSNNN